MEAHYSTMAVDVRWEDVIQPVEAAEAGSEVSVVLLPTEPNVIPTIAEPNSVGLFLSLRRFVFCPFFFAPTR